MADSKAAAQLIRELKEKGYTVIRSGELRCAVVVEGKRPVVIPGPRQRTAGRGILNIRAKLRRELGIDI